jgi:energy-coupling factor transporter ATP-binding protein EcfA2
MTAPTTPVRPADNPFSSHRIDNLEFRPQGRTWQQILERLEDLAWRAAVVGPAGSGKTTLLARLANRTPGETVGIRLVRGTPRPAADARALLPPTLCPRHVVLLDGADLLGPADWWRFRLATRHAGGLVIASHREGRLPTLVRCRTSPELLRSLVAELAPDASRRLDPVLDEVFTRHEGNIRGCLMELYDLYAGRKSGERSEE